MLTTDLDRLYIREQDGKLLYYRLVGDTQVPVCDVPVVYVESRSGASVSPVKYNPSVNVKTVPYWDGFVELHVVRYEYTIYVKSDLPVVIPITLHYLNAQCVSLYIPKLRGF